jgi:hypothetical protein
MDKIPTEEEINAVVDSIFGTDNTDKPSLITSKELESLQRNSTMLGKIACEVEGFCDHPDCTTLDAVKLMSAEIMILRGKALRQSVWSTYKE